MDFLKKNWRGTRCFQLKITKYLFTAMQWRVIMCHTVSQSVNSTSCCWFISEKISKIRLFPPSYFFLLHFVISLCVSASLREQFFFQVRFRFIQTSRLPGKTRVMHFLRKRSKELQKTPQKDKRRRSSGKFEHRFVALRTWTLRQTSRGARVHRPGSPTSCETRGISACSSEK